MCEIFANNSCRFCIFLLENVKQEVCRLSVWDNFYIERTSQVLKLSDLAVLSPLSSHQQNRDSSVPCLHEVTTLVFIWKMSLIKISGPVETGETFYLLHFFKVKRRPLGITVVCRWSRSETMSFAWRRCLPPSM